MSHSPIDTSRMTSQPTGGNESHSQPVISDVLHLTTGKAVRTVSEGNEAVGKFSLLILRELRASNYTNIFHFRDHILALLEYRLDCRGIKSAILNSGAFRWALPRKLEDIERWASLLDNPFETTTEGLRDLLKLTQVTRNAPVPSDTSFYIRSFRITAFEFGQIITSMIDRRYEMLNGNMKVWLDMVSDLGTASSKVTVWTIRYCGMTTRSPWERHMNDLKTARSKPRTWFFNLLHTIQNRFPHVIESAQVDVLDMDTSGLSSNNQLLHLYEQVLIALFNAGSMNVQAGGPNPVSAFTQEDERTFLTLGTKTIQSMETLTPCSDDVWKGVTRYAASVREYALAHPASTGVATIGGYSKKIREVVSKQATPSFMHLDCALMITLASDLGYHNETPTAFFASDRRSASIVRDCYDHMEHWENGFGSAFQPGTVVRLLRKGKLPFVDVYPWFHKQNTDFPAAAKFLMDYMRLSEPVIILTYGKLATCVALSSFTESSEKFIWKVRKDVNAEEDPNWFTSRVGTPTWCSIGPEGDPVVVIPCFHPGHISYTGPLAPYLIKVFFLVHQIAWFAMGVAMNCDESLPRNAVCEKVLREVKRILRPQHEFGKKFSRSLEKLKIIQQAFAEDKKFRRLQKMRSQSKPTKVSQPRRFVQDPREPIRSDHGHGGFLVDIKSHLFDEGTLEGEHDYLKYVLSWSEPRADDSTEHDRWTLGPMFLPSGIMDQSTYRYIWYTPEGLDIRNRDNVSLGDRVPVQSSIFKGCTLPISMIVLQTRVDSKTDQAFLSHWEEVTQLSIDRQMLSALDEGVPRPHRGEKSYHESFFKASPTKRPVPFPCIQSFTDDARQWYVSYIRNNLIPANPGDMLWLLKRFLANLCGADGVTFNFKPASEHDDSIFLCITRFCSKATYRYHPYWRTLLALAHASDTDKTARSFASHVVVIALETLAVYSCTSSASPKYAIANRKAFYDNRMSLQKDPKLVEFSEAHIQEDLGNSKQADNEAIVVSSGEEED